MIFCAADPQGCWFHWSAPRRSQKSGPPEARSSTTAERRSEVDTPNLHTLTTNKSQWWLTYFTVNFLPRRSQITPRNVEGARSPDARYPLLGHISQDLLQDDLTANACGSGGRRQGFCLFKTSQSTLGKFCAFALAPTYLSPHFRLLVDCFWMSRQAILLGS